MGLAVAAGVLVLSASRLSLAMALVVVCLAVFGARRLLPVLVVAVLVGSLAFGTSFGRGGFLHGRASTWEAAVDTFTDRPLVGTGADAFLAGSARHQGGETIVFAHNLPLELGAELGIAGFLLAIALYVAAGRVTWRARATPAGRLLGPGAAAFLVASLVDWPWHLAGSGAVWALCVGALLPFCASTKCTRTENSRRSSMTKNGLKVVAAVAALGVAGCGGSSNKALSYSDFSKQADVICKTTTVKTKAIGSALTGKAANDAPVYDKLIPAVQQGRDDIGSSRRRTS